LQGWGFLLGSDGVSSGSGVEVVEWREEWGRGLSGVVRFGEKGKLAPRFVGPFEIIKKVGPVAYRLDLLEEFNGVHDTFYVSNLKKCLVDPTLQMPLDEIQVNAKLNFVEEPVGILDREFKKLKRSRITIVKVRWNLKHGPKFTHDPTDVNSIDQVPSPLSFKREHILLVNDGSIMLKQALAMFHGS
nr:hypothetical protein [Tanacetum cinerariifolium]